MSQINEPSISIELWSENGLHFEILARVSKARHAKRFILAMRDECAGRTIRVCQGARLLWEVR